MTNVDLSLYLSEEKRYLHVLSIPLQKCLTFSLKPLKWLRYIGYCLYGRQGHLYSSPTLPSGNDSHADYDLPLLESRHYYYYSEDPMRIFDVEGIRDELTSSRITEKRKRFRKELIKRDGSCILMNVEVYNSVGVHITPQDKGDNYLDKLVRHRGGLDDFTAINDVRNGFLAYHGLHRWYRGGGFAFLKVPNFALDHTDIAFLPSDLREPDSLSLPPQTEVRYVMHHFAPEIDRTASLFVPHNKVARLFDGPNSPSSLITDLWYGCCAFQAWKVSEAEDQLRNMSKVYYDDESEVVDGVDNDEPDSIKSRRRLYDKRSHLSKDMTMKEDSSDEESSESQGHGSKGIENALDFVTSLWMKVSREDAERIKKEQKEEEERTMRESLSRVENWLESRRNA